MYRLMLVLLLGDLRRLLYVYVESYGLYIQKSIFGIQEINF